MIRLIIIVAKLDNFLALFYLSFVCCIFIL